ncbi:MAG: DTW domain-containing protein [Planctomycetes bacterium]|nr:DTW domain-containing protein [Planctomycetota bacterium]
MTPAETELRRGRCYRCLRPERLCHCADLPSVPTRTRIVILQHPHERTHPFGTARLVRLMMPNSEVHVPWSGFTGTLEQKLDLPPDTAVLYPSPDAPLLDELPRDRMPSTLVAIDGTWAHAKRLYRENGWLRALPHARLQPAQPSRYRIRREPRADYVSTLEAIVEALRVLEPEHTRLDELITAFDRMIDRQIAHTAVVERFGRRKETRQRPSRALSPLLADRRLAVVYAESALPGGDPAATRRIVHWVAARLDGDAGEVFETLVQPGEPAPVDHHLGHMGLSLADLADGEPHAAAAARFAAWLGDGAPVAAWTRTTLDWGEAMLPRGTATTALKVNYCNCINHSAGLLEDALAAQGLQPAAVPVRGRANARLGNAIAIARWLRGKQAALAGLWPR